MRYEYLNINDEGIKIFARIDDDGLCRVTCTENNPDYLRWLETANADETQQREGATNVTFN